MNIKFTKIMASFAVGMMLIYAADAATFTAIASGTWSSASTWSGGNVPGNNMISDDVTIGSGFIVDLDQDVTFGNGLLTSSTLHLDGTLSSATSDRTVTFAGGNLTGAGNMMVSHLKFNMAATLAFTGSIVVDEMENWLSLVSASHMKANRTAHMMGGLTMATGGQFELGDDATLIIEGGSLLSSGSGSLLFGSDYSVSYQGSSSSTSGSELSGSGLKNVTIDVGAGNNISLSSDVGINGTLSLTSGEMDLNGHHLNLKGNLAATGSGMIHSTDQSDMMIQGTGALTGALRFASSGNTVRNFMMNRTGSGSSMINLASDLNVKGVLTLTSGSMNMDNYKLDILDGGSISGGSKDSYIITGATGRLGLYLSSAASSYRTYPMGSNSQQYTPAAIRLVSGGNGMVRINAISQVYSQGTSGSDLSSTEKMVKGTWNITSEVSSNLNLDLKLMWAQASEVNGFNRSQGYISHYTSGSWDVMTSASATAEVDGMFSFTRTGITSLSPFSVRQGNATGINDIAAVNETQIYPNPATGFIMISNTGKVTVEIMNTLGQVVKMAEVSGSSPVDVTGLDRGNYFIKISSDNASTVKTFVKL